MALSRKTHFFGSPSNSAGGGGPLAASSSSTNNNASINNGNMSNNSMTNYGSTNNLSSLRSTSSGASEQPMMRRAATFHNANSSSVFGSLMASTRQADSEHFISTISQALEAEHLSNASNYESEEDERESACTSPSVNQPLVGLHHGPSPHRLSSLGPSRSLSHGLAVGANVGCSSRAGCSLQHSKPVMNSNGWAEGLTKKGSILPPGGKKEIKKFAKAMNDDDALEEMLEEVERAQQSKKCNFGDLNLTAWPGNVLTDAFIAPLTELLLSENAIATLPTEPFSLMKQLKKLDLANNSLTTVPYTILLLPELETLLCDHNSITSLPFAEAKTHGPLLPQIRVVGLEWNDLQQFPMEVITQCPMLQELYVGENQAIYSATHLPSAEQLAKVHRAPNTDGSVRMLTIKAVNSPALVNSVEQDHWAQRLPWIKMDWTKIYPDKVLDFLFLGSLRTAQTIPVYEDLNIGFVLTAGRGLDVKLSPGMKHLEIVVDDIPGANMIPLFERAFAFIDEAKVAKKGVLIHCFAGLSRSVTITAAYLMKTRYPMTRDEALALIRQSRPAAEPNKGFMDNLLQYEKQLREEHARQQTPPPQPQQSSSPAQRQPASPPLRPASTPAASPTSTSSSARPASPSSRTAIVAKSPTTPITATARSPKRVAPTSSNSNSNSSSKVVK